MSSVHSFCRPFVQSIWATTCLPATASCLYCLHAKTKISVKKQAPATPLNLCLQCAWEQQWGVPLKQLYCLICEFGMCQQEQVGRTWLGAVIPGNSGEVVHIHSECGEPSAYHAAQQCHCVWPCTPFSFTIYLLLLVSHATFKGTTASGLPKRQPCLVPFSWRTFWRSSSPVMASWGGFHDSKSLSLASLVIHSPTSESSFFVQLPERVFFFRGGWFSSKGRGSEYWYPK